MKIENQQIAKVIYELINMEEPNNNSLRKIEIILKNQDQVINLFWANSKITPLEIVEIIDTISNYEYTDKSKDEIELMYENLENQCLNFDVDYSLNLQAEIDDLIIIGEDLNINALHLIKFKKMLKEFKFISATQKNNKIDEMLFDIFSETWKELGYSDYDEPQNKEEYSHMVKVISRRFKKFKKKIYSH